MIIYIFIYLKPTYNSNCKVKKVHENYIELNISNNCIIVKRMKFHSITDNKFEKVKNIKMKYWLNKINEALSN